MTTFTEQTATTNKWEAIESNPDVLAKLLAQVGVADGWTITDVYGLDAELLAMVPQGYKRQTVADAQKASAFYLDQVAGLPNACGTIATLHAVANNKATLNFTDDSVMGQFLAAAEGKTPTEIGTLLANYGPIRDLHNALVEQGQTEKIPDGERVGHHFVCLVELDGHIVELDGAYRDAPVRHRAVGADGFLVAAAQVVKEEFLAKSDSVNFAITALVKAE